MPFCTPQTMTTWVMAKKTSIHTMGFQGWEENWEK